MRAESTLAVLLLAALAAGCSDDGLPGDTGAPDGAPRDAVVERSMSDTHADGGGDLGATDAGVDADAGAASGGVYELKVSARTLRLHVVGDDLVRVHYLRPGKQPHPDRGWTTVPGTSWPTKKLSFTDAGSYLYHKTARLEIRVVKQDAAVSFLDLSGKVISEDVPDQTGGAYVLKVRKKLPADEHFYGFGEKTGPLDKRGQQLQMWTTDPLYPTSNYTPTTDPIYQSHPVAIGLRGGKAYGLYLNSTFRTHFDMGKSVAGELELRTEGGDLDYLFFYGPGIERVVQLYTGVTGRTPLPPLWALGYHQCRWSYYPEAVVRQITAEFRKRKIPCDGFWLDIDYMDGFRSFTWDTTRFPNPWKLLSDLGQQGFKVTAIIDPGIKVDTSGSYKVYSDGVAQGHFVTMPDKSLYVGKVWPGQAVFPDFTRAKTRAWWSGLVKSFVGTGLRGVWIDMNEPVTWDPQGFPLTSVFDGEGTVTDHEEARNVYALLMARATREGLDQALPTGRPFVLTRSGFAGIQRYATVWTGDMQSSWAHLKMAPAMLMNLGLSGVAFAGTDVGGFSGSPTPELYARWIQLGAISPFFRSHVQEKTPPQEPWSFGAQVEAISKEHIELRYRLLPYVYSLMWHSSRTGAPPLRPLLYEFSADAKTYDRSHELLLGPWLLAAPVLDAGRKARALYLPEGPWFDYHGAAVFSGKQQASVAAPLTRLPLLVRAGGILPTTEAMQYVGQTTPTTLYLDLYPVNGVKPTELTLYRDDGATRAHQKGVYQRLPLRLETTAAGATLVVSAPTGSYAPPEQHLRLRLHGVVKAPSGVTAGGAALAKLGGAAELATKDGWYHDAAARVAHARVPYPKGATKVACSYDATAKLVTPVKVTISVALPANTPAGTVYLASNLYGWEPDGKAMTRMGSTASVTLNLEAGMTISYKFTRGSWTKVEKEGACKELDNRLLTVVDQGGGVMKVSDTVSAWADLCP